MSRRKIIPLSANAKPLGGLNNLPPPNPVQDMADVQEARSLGYDLRGGMIDMGHLRAWLSERRAGIEPPKPRISGLPRYKAPF
ncbi:hypothetical protein ACFZ8E_19185 [Methylobacterium sp. HMF5984]|uniref:hypothetical protein n=1 Tax=Methylobacterium sp. HMF5984 TaxID=3367370 RepID=UPI003853D7E2